MVDGDRQTEEEEIIRRGVIGVETLGHVLDLEVTSRRSRGWKFDGVVVTGGW